MDSKQKAHIEVNLVELIRNTTCDVQLLSIFLQNGILSQSDYEDVHTLRTPSEKAKRLYEILPTRNGSFPVLLSALKELRQTGAHRILQQTECQIQDFGLISVDITHVLGKGRSGTKVYQGMFDGREVAVKVIKEEPEEALREVAILKKLDNHQNIVRYFMAEPKNDKVYIALELCLINLEDEMKMHLVNPKPIDVLKSCASGLAFLHENGILHRDLKPANILLNRLGQVKISDFGFSKKLEAGRSAASASGVVGTADWMAPELLILLQDGSQSKITVKATAKADIFSLGCVFYFVLSNGQHLFGDGFKRPQNIIDNSPQWENVSLHANFKELIGKMVSYLPTERPSAEAVSSWNGLIQFAVSSPFVANQNRESTGIMNKIAPLGERTIEKNDGPELSPSVSDRSNSNGNTEQNNTTNNRLELVPSMREHIDRLVKQYGIPKEHVEKLTTNINAAGIDGKTLMHYVAQSGSVDTLTSLVKLGCDIKAKDASNQTVLHYAAQVGNSEAIKYLVALGADIKARDDFNRAPIHCVVDTRKNFVGTLRALMKAGSDINAKIRTMKETPLLYAIRVKRSIQDLEEIVGFGGDWKVKDSLGNSVIHYSVKHQNIEALKHFVRLGAPLNVKNIFSDSPIHLIDKYTDDTCAINILRVLVQNGADINACDNWGENVLNRIKSQGYASNDVIKEIIKLGGKERYKVKDCRIF